jgi:hypothetical protein
MLTAEGARKLYENYYSNVDVNELLDAIELCAANGQEFCNVVETDILEQQKCKLRNLGYFIHRPDMGFVVVEW